MQANPTNDRLNFILKTYGKKWPFVVANMVDIIANTVGEDRWVQQVADAAQADPEFFRIFSLWNTWRLAGGRDPFPYHLEQKMEGVAKLDGRPNLVYEFVTTLVALANELPGFRKRHRADPLFPWMARELVEVRKEELAKRDPRPTYEALARDAKRNGSTLALWYERTRPNLGEVTLSDALIEAKDWADENAPIPQGEIVTKLSDGWTAQKLTTQECLSAEGDRMQHCVGSYYSKVKSDGTTIYSLRDKGGNPHVTIEVKNGRVQQTQGKQNEKPAEKYQKYVDEFNEWLKEQDIDTEKYPKELVPYVGVLEEHGNLDYEDDIGWVAQEWRENVGSPEKTEAWLNAGFHAGEAKQAGALQDENVTPEELKQFPYAVYRKMFESGEPHVDMDDLVKVARMSVLLKTLAPQRQKPKEPDQSQLSLFDGIPVPEEVAIQRFLKHQEQRLAGHDTTGLVPVKRKWDKEPRHLWPSLQFETWSFESGYGHDEGDDIEWLYPAEEWLAESFTSDETDDEYVGPWFIHYFTPQQGTDWWEAGVEDGHLAAALRDYGINPELIAASVRGDNLAARDVVDSIEEMAKLKRKAVRDTNDLDAADVATQRFAKIVAQQIRDQLVDAAALQRNARRKRTSRRTSRRTR